MKLASASFGARISWLQEIPKDVLMTASAFLGMAIEIEFDHHFNRPSA
jgi:hypothetical protein